MIESRVPFSRLQLPQVGSVDAGALPEDVMGPPVHDSKLANPDSQYRAIARNPVCQHCLESRPRRH